MKPSDTQPYSPWYLCPLPASLALLFRKARKRERVKEVGLRCGLFFIHEAGPVVTLVGNRVQGTCFLDFLLPSFHRKSTCYVFFNAHFKQGCYHTLGKTLVVTYCVNADGCVVNTVVVVGPVY